jgi:hypothetical protein
MIMNSKQVFYNLLNEAGEEQNQAAVDCSKKEEWLKSVEEFYDTIKQFLKEAKESNKLHYNFEDKQIVENRIGAYTVKIMNIQFGDYYAQFEPIGTNIIAAYGRIDLKGANSDARFVLVDKEQTKPITKSFMTDHQSTTFALKGKQSAEKEWKLATPPPNIEYLDLTEELFFEVLLEVVGG